VRNQPFQSSGLSATSRNRKSGSAPAARAALRRAARASIESLESRTLLSATLTPTADAFVRDHNYTLTNFGASPLLFVKTATSGDDRTAYLKFDLTGITSLNNATLQLSGALESPQTPATDVGIFPVADSSWVEGDGTIVNRAGDGFDTDNSPAGEITWNNAPALAGSAIATATVSRDSFQTYSFDVTSYLQQQITAGNTIVTLALKNTQPTYYGATEFLSRESASDPSTQGQGSIPQLVISDAASAAPAAVVSAPDVASPGANEIVTVNYSSGAGIDLTTIAASNIAVTANSGGALNVSNVTTQPGPNNSVIASYTVDAPNGSWSAGNNGAYTISVAAGSVKDLSGAGVAAAFGAFRVNVGDTVPPVATISPPPDITTAGGGNVSFNVTYTDNVAVDASTILVENVSVTGPAGPLNITGVTIVPTGNAAQVVATYTAQAPNGAWDASDNGQYLITANGNQILDTAGNPSALTTANFNVAVAIPDTTPPVVASIAAPSVMGPGGTSESVTVVYTDNVAINTASLGINNITVASPAGAALAVTGETFSPSNGGQTVTAVYTVAPPDGAWSASDNGTYTISVVAGQVTDTSNNPVGPASGTFNVSASVADTQPPVAVISAPAITAVGSVPQSVNVVYSDNVAVAVSSIDMTDLSVSGPGGPLTVTGVQVSGSGASITASYTVAPPNGAWDASANGTYTVALNANQVRDTSGNSAAITFGQFVVNIPNPNPTDATFAGGNPVATTFVAEAVATQPDGKILVAGHQAAGTTQSQGVVERLNADGSLDTSFGAGGQVVTPAGNNDWYAITIQGANHFVVAGTDGGDFALARFDFSGNLDPTFGSRGLTVTDFGTPSDIAYGVALAPSGQILAVGTSNNHFAFARYDANGNIDASFGAGGRQLFDTGAATQVLGAVSVMADGKVVAVGSSAAAVDVVRLTATGDLDATFGTDGLVVVPGLAARQDVSGPDYTEALALQGDGKILVANKTTGGHMGLARLATNGSLDATFGNAGLVTANFGGDDDADSVVLQSSGAILLIGTSLQNGQPMTGVAAFDSSGTPITSFGNSGKYAFAASVAPTSRELHIGDLVLRAFGTATTGGKLLVGNGAVSTQTVSSTLRRLIVPGTTSAPGIQRTSLGVFGMVNGKRTILKVSLGNGRFAFFTLTSGTGTAWQSGTAIELDITSQGNGAALTITVKGGGRVSLSDIIVTGSLKGIKAPAADLSGTLSATGSIGSAVLGNINSVTVTGGLGSLVAGNVAGTLAVGGSVSRMKVGAVTGRIIVVGSLANLIAGNVSGSVYSGSILRNAKVASLTGTVEAASQIGTLVAANLSHATVLAGVNSGASALEDGTIYLGGTNTYAAGTINSLRVAGAITASFVGAGVNPIDGIYGNGNDTSAGIGLIKTIFAKSGADSTSRFESSAFGIVRFPPARIDPATDPRFKVL